MDRTSKIYTASIGATWCFLSTHAASFASSPRLPACRRMMESLLFEISLNLDASRVAWSEETSLGTVVDSHPLLFGLYPFVVIHMPLISQALEFTVVLAVEDVGPDPLHVSAFFVVFSGLFFFLRITHVPSPLSSVGSELVSTAFRCGKACWRFTSTTCTRARCASSSAFLTVWLLICILNPRVSGSLHVPGPLYYFPMTHNLGSSFGLLKFAVNPFTTTLSVIPSPVRMARQPRHWAARPNFANISQVSEAYSPGHDWRFYARRASAFVASCLMPQGTRMLTCPARSPSRGHGVPPILCENSPSHLS